MTERLWYYGSIAAMVFIALMVLGYIAEGAVARQDLICQEGGC